MERSRALGPRCSVLTCDTERRQRLGGRFERVVGANGEKRAGDRARHAAGAGDRPEQRMAVLDRDHTLAVRDVVDAAGDRGDDPERGSRQSGPRRPPNRRRRSTPRRAPRRRLRQASPPRRHSPAGRRRRPRRGSASQCRCDIASHRHRPDRGRPARLGRSRHARRSALRRPTTTTACRCSRRARRQGRPSPRPPRARAPSREAPRSQAWRSPFRS